MAYPRPSAVWIATGKDVDTDVRPLARRDLHHGSGGPLLKVRLIDTYGAIAEAVGVIAVGWTATLRGPLPIGIVAVTVCVPRSMTDRSFEVSLVTYAVLLSEVVAVQCGMVPTLTAPSVVYASGSTRSSSPGP